MHSEVSASEIPGTPSGVVANLVVDIDDRKAANKIRSKGIKADLSAFFEKPPKTTIFRLLPLSSKRMTAIQSTYDTKIRAELPKLRDGDALPSLARMESNRYAVAMSILSVEGSFRVKGKTTVFDGTEKSEDVRSYFAEHFLPAIDYSVTESVANDEDLDNAFLGALLAKHTAISNLTVAEILARGEDLLVGAGAAPSYSG